MIETTTRTIKNLKKTKVLMSKVLICNLVLSCFFILVFSLTGPVTTYLYKIIIDTISTTLNYMPLIIVIYILVQCIGEISELTNEYFKQKIQFSLNENLYNFINKKMGKVALEELESPDIYDLLDRVSRHLPANMLNLINSCTSIIAPTFTTIFYSLLLYTVKWYFPLIVILSSIPYFFLSWIKAKDTYAQQVALSSDQRRMEYLSSVLTDRKYSKEVNLFKLSIYINKKICLIRNKVFKQQVHLEFKYTIYELMINIIRNIALGICLIIVCYDVIYNSATIGNVVLILSSVQAVMNGIISLMQQSSCFYQNALYLSDLTAFDKLPNENNSESENDLQIENTEIILDNISFNYPNSKVPTLKNISLSIKPLEKIAIVGENGSGKSTLVNLILGNYKPTSGKIIVGNHDLQDVLKNYREITVPIMQNFIKYQLSVEENIQVGTFGNPIRYKIFDYKETENFIESLPLKFKTILGQLNEGSVELSGGQWQWLAIYRAMARENAKILIMDEPTASLDPIAEGKIYENFTRISKGKTVVLISHRLSSTILCDKIYVLHKGEIVEEGNHNELMKKKGRYYNMFTLQSELYEQE